MAMAKRFLDFLIVAIFSATFLTGCTMPANPLTSLMDEKKADDELVNGDMAAIEGALLANRLLAAVSFSDPSVVVLGGTTEGVTGFTFRGKAYGGKHTGGSTSVFREQSGCVVSLADAGTASNTVVMVGTDTCRLEKSGTAGYRFSWKNGNSFTVTPSATVKGENTLQARGTDWNLTFPEGAGTAALFVLKNPKTGRLLTMFEDNQGNLSLTTEKKVSFKGGWSVDGIVALIENTTGVRCLYRAGQWYFPPGS